MPLSGDTPTLTARPGGSRPALTPWVDAGVSRDGRTLIVRFEAAAGCDWLDHVDTDESSGRVRVSVYVARDPRFDNVGNGPLVACAEPGTYEAARVTLGKPLRGRMVVDGGAADAPRPVQRMTSG